MDNFSVDEGLILAYELHMSECLCLCIQKRSCLFSLLIFFFLLVIGSFCSIFSQP